MDKQFETDHYIFHYGANTKAEQDISEIAPIRKAASAIFAMC